MYAMFQQGGECLLHSFENFFLWRLFRHLIFNHSSKVIGKDTCFTVIQPVPKSTSFINIVAKLFMNIFHSIYKPAGR